MNTDLARWLAEAMERAGLNQSEVARRLTVLLNRPFQRSMVNKMILGSRAIRGDEMIALRNMFGEALPSAQASVKVPLRGRILNGGHIIMDDASGVVDAPQEATPKTAALIVEGNSLYPQAEHGWLLFYEDTRAAPAQHSLGRMCVVELADGRVLARRLELGTEPGSHDLCAVNAPPIKNVSVAWAAPVTWIKPR